MGTRSRKRRRIIGAPTTPVPRVRGEERNEQLRAELQALGPGERPRAVTVAAVLALVFAVANIALALAGYDIRGQKGASAGGAIVFAVIMLVAAAGMWLVRYWAVLGFQCLLALTALYGSAGLLVASNIQAVVLCLFVVGASGTLFWFLIRAMARIQLPQRPGAR